MRTVLFDFELPEELIALQPAEPREAARLLVVTPRGDRDGVEQARLEHLTIAELPDLLAPGDLLVLNDTRVIPAALEGLRTRGESRQQVSFNLTERLDESRWRALARPGRRLAVGDRVRFGHDGAVCLLGTLDGTIEAKRSDGTVDIAFAFHGAVLDEAIEILGRMPLPPYISERRPVAASDERNYQTAYARVPGAVAAPTAGLHLSPGLLAKLKRGGVEIAFVTLHVGAGTFLPVKVEETADHVMHAEWGEIGEATAAAVTAARVRGARVVAGGTTALRLLETAGRDDGTVAPWSGRTAIFITPGHRFRVVDRLLTNFHLPRSTLFMLVAAFAGLDTMHHAYREAIGAGYRFYSYGDASLLTRRASTAESAYSGTAHAQDAARWLRRSSVPQQQ